MLRAEGLTKRYGPATVLDRLDLEVAPGEIVALLGANGAGKSTTIKLFLGFIAPSAGRALVDGASVSDDPVVARRKLAYIPESVALHDRLTGRENLVYFAELGGAKLDRRTADALLDRVGLDRTAADRRVDGYSKGMRQKVGVAVALAKRARALLLDEPTSGLDPAASAEVSRLVRELAADGAAVLTVTHDIFRAREDARRIGIMKRGRLVALLNAADIGHAELEQLYLDHMAGAA